MGHHTHSFVGKLLLTCRLPLKEDATERFLLQLLANWLDSSYALVGTASSSWHLSVPSQLRCSHTQELYSKECEGGCVNQGFVWHMLSLLL